MYDFNILLRFLGSGNEIQVHFTDSQDVKATNIWLEYSALINANLAIAAFLLFQTLESGFPGLDL